MGRFKQICAAIAIGCIATIPLEARTLSAAERAQGEQNHPQLLQQYGGAYRGPQAALAERVGKRVAVQSGVSNAQSDFTVTLLDSPVENAFAIPGGYVYVTRQLLALMNSEDELAAVLGHEVGHVAARHAQRRNTRAAIGNILSTGIGILTGSSALGQVAGMGSQLYTLGYSRSQEYEADGLGVRYSSAAGYNPYGMADMLADLTASATLAARAAGRDANALPSWASTHPNGAERVRRARQLAQGIRGATPPARQDTAFLRALDGLRYDDDPAQGIVDGRTFRHPGLRLRFTVPEGYAIANGTSAVTIAGSGGQAQFKTGPATRDLAGFVTARFSDLGGQNVVAQPTRIGNLDAAAARVQANAGNQRVDVTVVAFPLRSSTGYFTLIAPAGGGNGPFTPLLASVTTLDDGEAAAIRGKIVRIQTVQRGDTIDSLSRRMAYPTLQRERFLTINAIETDADLVPGMLVKLVVNE